MKKLFTALLFVLAAGSGFGQALVEDFENTGTWSWSPWVNVSAPTSSKLASSAHSGTYGVSLTGEWVYRTDVTVGNAGDVISCWFRFSVAGRLYMGFGASSAGCYSLVASPNVGPSVLFQQNATYGNADLGSSPCTYALNTWYKMEIVFNSTTNITGNIYASDGTTLIGTVNQTIAGLTPGGLALRGFGPVDIDEIRAGTPSSGGGGGGNAKVPPLASFVYDINTDTIWQQSPATLINTSNNASKSFWDITGYNATSKTGPWSAFTPTSARQCATRFTAPNCFIDTVGNNGNFHYTFTTRGYYKIRLLTENAFGTNFTEKVIYVDQPSSPPVVDFFATMTTIGVFGQTSLIDISSNGPTSWVWSTNPFCTRCDPNFLNTFSPGNNVQNPTLAAFDPGVYGVCLTATNSKGSTTVCKPNYITITNGYTMCGGSVVSSTDMDGIVYLPLQGGVYQPSNLTSCAAGFKIAPCSDSIRVYFDQVFLRSQDTIYVRTGSVTGPVVRKYAGRPGSTPAVTIPSGEVYLSLFIGTPNSIGNQGDSGIAIRWHGYPAGFTKPAAGFSAPDTIYSGYKVKYNNTSAGVKMQYSWDTDGDNIYGLDQPGSGVIDSTTLSPSRTFTTSTVLNKKICVKAYNCQGSDTACRKLVVMPITLAPVADFTVSRFQGFTTDTFAFTDRTRNGALQWKWRFEPNNVAYLNGTDSTSQNPVVLLNSAAQYTVTLIAANPVGSNTISKPTYVEALAYNSPNTAFPIQSGQDIGITRVRLNTIDTTTDLHDKVYTDLSNLQRTTLYRGVDYQVRVSRTTAVSPMTTKVWIDYNRNASFEPATEQIVSDVNTNKTLIAQTFRIPDTAPVGSTRMRVGAGFGSTVLSASSAVIGCYEDYGIVIGQDLTRPVIVLKGSQVMRIELNRPYVEPGVTATDNLEGDISSRYEVSGTVNTAQLGYYQLKYYVKDLYGNISDTVIRIVQVEINQTGPSISLSGADTMMISVYSQFSDPGATALDNTGNNISAQIVKSSTLDTAHIGNYTIIYQVTDAFNFTVSKTRVVLVRDTTRPELYNLQNNTDTVHHQVGTPYVDGNYVGVRDNYWNNLSPVRVDGQLNVNLTGGYTLKYRATDGSGNASPDYVLHVDVRDRIAPELTLNGSDEMTVDVYTLWQEPGYRATDNYYPNVTVTITPAAPDMTRDTTITLTYTACDRDGNCTSKTRIVHVKDREAPVLKLKGDNPLTIKRYQWINDPGYTVTDNYDPASAISVEWDSSHVKRDIPGYYYINYKATDRSRNTTTEVKRLVHVEDVTTGINDLAAKEIGIYPNPAKDKVYVQLNAAGISSVRVYNMLGAKVRELSVHAKQTTLEIDLSNEKEGMYIIKAEGNGATYTGKLNLVK